MRWPAADPRACGRVAGAAGGLKQTRRRSPGNSGLRISATVSGTSASGRRGAPAGLPLGAFSSLRRSTVRRAEIQSRPTGNRSVRMRAEVIMPRSPTRATRRTPKRSRILRTWAASVVGSAVLPGKTFDRDRTAVSGAEQAEEPSAFSPSFRRGCDRRRPTGIAAPRGRSRSRRRGSGWCCEDACGKDFGRSRVGGC